MRSSDSSTPAENAAVELEAVSMIYGSNGSKVAALDALSLVFARGTFTAVMGPSGLRKDDALAVGLRSRSTDQGDGVGTSPYRRICVCSCSSARDFSRSPPRLCRRGSYSAGP
jgi:hypothetical protein